MALVAKNFYRHVEGIGYMTCHINSLRGSERLLGYFIFQQMMLFLVINCVLVMSYVGCIEGNKYTRLLFNKIP